MNLEIAGRIFHSVMGSYSGYWGVAGGWAVDFFLGVDTRPHEDLEVVVLRREHAPLYSLLKGFRPQLIFAGPEPEFRAWTGEPFPEAVIQLRLRETFAGKSFDLLLTPAEGESWICRRDETMRLPLDETLRATAAGIPVLAPEIVLLFKAKYDEEKSERDFAALAPALGEAAHRWLREALTRVHPGHRWLARL